MSKNRLRVLGAFALVLTGVQAGCDTPPTGPEAATPRASVSGAPLLPMVEWNAPRATAASVTRKVGPLGGVVSAGGVSLTVPPLALARSTSITLTVPAGEYVMVDLQPHGLQFRLPSLLVFPLLGTDAGPLSGLVGVYSASVPQNGLIEATELFDVSLVGSGVGFQINHFSTYAPAQRGGLILIGG